MKNAIFCLLCMFCMSAAQAGETVDFKVETVASGLDGPWSLAFLENGDILVTEKPGRLRLIVGGELQDQSIEGVPPVQYTGQSGLFDVVLHPDYANNKYIYLTYAHGDSRNNATRIARGTFDGRALKNVETLYTVTPMKNTSAHYGGQLTFLPDGTMLLSTGDGFNFREKAQDLSNGLGKVMRLNDDGSTPADNPFVGQDGVLLEVFTYGHRNPQGLYVDPKTNIIYEAEHGPRGGDEINILEPGKNYGWPIATYGIDYSGAQISPFTEYEGTEQPLLHWTPSIAPGAFVVYRGEMFPEWDGDLLVAALVLQHIRHVDLEDGKVVGQTELLKDRKRRFRDVQVGPDGSVYLLTDHPQNDNDVSGEVLRVYR